MTKGLRARPATSLDLAPQHSNLDWRGVALWTAALFLLGGPSSAIAQGPGKPPPGGTSSAPPESEQGSAAGPAKAPTIEDKTKDSKNKLDEVSLPLVRHGVLFGTGLAVQTPTPGNPDRSVERAATTVIAYIGVSPGYLFFHDQDLTNAYCSSIHPETARTRADRLAILETLHKDVSEAEILKPEYAHERALIAEQRGWHIGAEPRCGFWRRVGVVVGLPTSFWTDVEQNGRRENIEVHPLISVAAVVAPLPWLNLIGGATFSNAATGDIMTRTNHVVTTMFFGIGVPLDAFTAALK